MASTKAATIRIAVSGKKKHGKSTMTKHLRSIFGGEILAFAGPLKEACSAMFGLSPDLFNDEKSKETVVPEYGVTPRKIMQTVGMLMRNDLHREMPELKTVPGDLWSDLLIKRVRAASGNVFIEDLRMPNESTAVKNEGIIRVRVVRPGSEPVDTHISEQGCEVDFEILNDGTEEDFKHKINEFMVKQFGGIGSKKESAGSTLQFNLAENF